MRHTSTKSGSSLRIAFIFLCSIVLLIFGGFLLKLFLVLRASSFDGVHQYIVEIDEGQQKGDIVAFSPQTSSVVVLRVSGKMDTGYSAYLGVPVDGSVVMAFPANPSELASSLLLHGKKEKGITIIDKLRLLIFVNSLKPSDFHETSLSLPVDVSVSEKLLPTLFQDNTLYNANESVAVINATGQSGLGSEIARQLTTIGMNVVSVTTAANEQNDTTLSANHTNTYTVARLGRLFHVSANQVSNIGLSDIILTVGKNSLSAVQ